MERVPLEARIKNRTGKERCRWCAGNGYVVVQTRKPDRVRVAGTRIQGEASTESFHDEMGPCPFCESGFAEEFPDTSKDTSIRPPWGEEGFWKGRQPVELVPLEAADARPLPPAVQRERLRELLETTGLGSIPEAEPGTV